MSPPPAPLPATPARLRTALLSWYDGARRSLPWRAAPGDVADPWAVLVSEIMLQQTTVATVGPRFEPFLDRFPSPAAMADAPLDDVLHAWQGLGYYRRARGLHAAAVAIVERHGGQLPGTVEALATLPGVGPYTAAAVAAIAFGASRRPDRRQCRAGSGPAARPCGGAQPDQGRASAGGAGAGDQRAGGRSGPGIDGAGRVALHAAPAGLPRAVPGRSPVGHTRRAMLRADRSRRPRRRGRRAMP